MTEKQISDFYEIVKQRFKEECGITEPDNLLLIFTSFLMYHDNEAIMKAFNIFNEEVTKIDNQLNRMRR